ncbi:MAG TPA: zinc ABC transporter substrate-binding protein, partial [Hyphomicrobiaceae bacterium]|nr:zinc ABC transporter substrate-binding protein [Hyphomicrobiaceae bacterium]
MVAGGIGDVLVSNEVAGAAKLERLAALAGKARILRLDREKSLKLLKAREGGLWEGEDDDHGKADVYTRDEIDGHVWLDPDNAAAIVRAAVRELSALDKENAGKYAANG